MTFSAVLAIVLKTIWPIMQGIVQMIGSGIFLGIGFWIAKLITGKLDELRVISDKDFMEELKQAI